MKFRGPAQERHPRRVRAVGVITAGWLTFPVMLVEKDEASKELAKEHAARVGYQPRL